MKRNFDLRRLTLNDAPSATHMSASVGWVFSETAWTRMIGLSGDGAFGVFDGERVIATACAFIYGDVLAWLGIVITDSAYQGQGLSRRVTSAAMDYILAQNVRRVMLDASNAGYPLYASLGFQPLYQVETWTGQAVSQPTDRDVCVITESDIEDIIALDQIVFGVRRTAVIRRIITDAAGRGWVMRDDDTLTGYILLQQRNHEMIQVGPWVHQSDDGAALLFGAAIRSLSDYQLRLNIPQPNQVARQIASQYDLHSQSACTRMIYGDAQAPGRMTEQYAIASFATG